MKSLWLVEIRVKDWVGVPKGQSRTVGYEEVEALDEFGARRAGFDQFARLVKHVPVKRRHFEQHGLAITDYCAPEAIEI